MDSNIACPKCGESIALTEALTHSLRESMREEFLKDVTRQKAQIAEERTAMNAQLEQIEQEKEDIGRRVAEELKKKTAEVEQKASARVREQTDEQMRDFQRQLEEKDSRLKKFQQAELELRSRQRELEEKQKGIELEIARKLDAEREKLVGEAAQKFERERKIKDAEKDRQLQSQLREFQEQLTEKDSRLQQLQQNELELRREKRQLEEKKQSLELDVARKLDEEREKIQSHARMLADEEYRLVIGEKNKILADMSKQIDELKRKSEQKSQQLQGEVLELQLEELLKAQFPHDQFEPVAKGMRGADLVHKVINRSGELCGCIVWEIKQTKNWMPSWIDKLKEDARSIKGSHMVIVSSALPGDVRSFCHRDGVFITCYDSAVALATVLRMSLEHVAMAHRSSDGKMEKQELLFKYVTGTDFYNRLAPLVEMFMNMKKQVDEERRVFEKAWATREKQVHVAMTSTSGLWGDLQGILDSSLRHIDSLEFKQIAEPKRRPMDEPAGRGKTLQDVAFDATLGVGTPQFFE